MRKFILPLTYVLLLPTFAQTVILEEHQPAPGDVCTYFEGVRPFIQWQPQSGIWDFTTLTSPVSATTTFMAATGAPGISAFPSSDLVAQSSYGGYTYYRREADALQLLGSGLPQFNSFTIYSDPMKVMTYPCGLGTTWTDHYSYTTPGSPQLYGTTTWNVTAEGTLMLPAGTVPDVLMIHAERILMGANNLPLVIYNEYSLRSPHFSCELVFGVHQQLFNNGVLTSEEHQFQVLNNETLGMTGHRSSAHTLELWPVPVSDQLHFRSSMPGGATPVLVLVSDPRGRIMHSASFRAGDLDAGASIDVSGLASGTYVIHLDGSFSRTFLVE
jgi:hypothetical protein